MELGVEMQGELVEQERRGMGSGSGSIISKVSQRGM